MSAFLNFAGNARRNATLAGAKIGIPQLKTLVIQRRWRQDDQHYQDFIELTCYADFVDPIEGKPIFGEGLITTSDYKVQGLDLTQYSLRDFVSTASGFWLGSTLVSNTVNGGFACDLISYREHTLTLDLYLRKKPDQR